MIQVAILLLLVLIICYCAQCNSRELLTNNTSQLTGRGLDGITEGFEHNAKDQLAMLKQTFTHQIAPILTDFARKYKQSPTLQRQFRLRRQGQPLDSHELNMVYAFVNGVLEFKVENLYENVNPPENETSYTTNKTFIYMCLRNSEGRVHSDDILLFAFVHELAHAGCDEQGHSDMFWCYFRLLLQILCQYNAPGIPEWQIKYCTKDLRNNPYSNYCNTFTVKYNPLFDKDAYM